jgi:hypothetical protein
VSRLSTDFTRRWRAAGRIAGLAVGRNEIRYIELKCRAGLAYVQSSNTVSFDVPLFEFEPTASCRSSLFTAIKAISADIERRYIPLHISLPDPLVRTAVFELDALPKGQAMQNALVQLRMQRDLSLQDCRYASQGLGVERGGKQLLFGTAISSAWHKAVTDALYSAGLMPWSMAGNITRLFNIFENQMAGDGGALIALDNDAWSILIFDAMGAVRFCRSQWRSAGMTDSDIASEIQRAIMSFVHSSDNKSVGLIWLVASCDATEILNELNQRSGNSCRLLTMTDRVRATSEMPDIFRYTTPMAAALQ